MNQTLESTTQEKGAFIIPSETLQEIIQEAAKIESEYQLRCVAVFNPYKPGFGGGVIAVSAILFPSEGEFFDSAAFKERVNRCCKEENDKWFVEMHSWAFIFSMSDSSCKKWFCRFQDKPERFPLADLAAGADLISEVLYGEELMDKIKEEAKAFFGQDIIDFWKKIVPQQLAERQARLVETEQKLIAYRKERQKLLNKYELEELKGLLKYIAKLKSKGQIKCLVALDGSGRPIGKAAQWFFGKNFPIFFIDPHPIRDFWLKSDGEKKIEHAVSIFKKEMPKLYQIWRRQPKTVLVIDDQSGYGHTAQVLNEFVRAMTESDHLNLAVMSQFQGDNTPSWLRQRQIQGIQLVKDKLTFLAINKKTLESRKFYSRLKKHVMDWRKEIL